VLGFCATQWQGRLMKITALLLVFLVVFSRAIFGAESLDELRKKAEAGDAWSQLELGIKYEVGVFGQIDLVNSALWYKRAAEQGDFVAQSWLAKRYYDGSGVPRDFAKAAFWFRKAAEQKSPDDQFMLGKMYALGQGVPRDQVEAFIWFYVAGRGGYDPKDEDLKLMVGVASKARNAETDKLARVRFEKFGNIIK